MRKIQQSRSHDDGWNLRLLTGREFRNHRLDIQQFVISTTKVYTQQIASKILQFMGKNKKCCRLSEKSFQVRIKGFFDCQSTWNRPEVVVDSLPLCFVRRQRIKSYSCSWQEQQTDTLAARLWLHSTNAILINGFFSLLHHDYIRVWNNSLCPVHRICTHILNATTMSRIYKINIVD